MSIDSHPTRALHDSKEPEADRSSELLWLYEQFLALNHTERSSADTLRASEGSTRWQDAFQCLELMARVWPRPKPLQAADERRKLGRFLIEGELGRGGTSVVFLALDPELKRPVALKVPRPATLASEDLRRRFIQEGRAAARLKHPNIVGVYEANGSQAACYLATEFCNGPSLAKWLRKRTTLVPPRIAAQWVADLANAVQHAHDRDILHRDIKPSNVLLEPASDGPGAKLPGDDVNGEFAFVVRLADFGLAKLIVNSTDGETVQGAILGTPAYMPPEQAGGRTEEVGPHSDTYSLGAVLYELLTNRPPFQGESDLDCLKRVEEDDPVPPRRLNPSIPADLETICLKCLSKDAAGRYPTAEDLEADLRSFLAGEPIQARPASLFDRCRKWTRRNPGPAATWGTGILSVLILGLVMLWHFEEVGGRDQRLADAQEQQQLQAAEVRVNADLAWQNQYAAWVRSVQSLAESNQTAVAVGRLEELRAESTAERPLTFAWRYWWNVCRKKNPFPLAGMRGQGTSIAFAPRKPSSSGSATLRSEQLAAGTHLGTVVIWDQTTARVQRTLSFCDSDVDCLAYSPQGRYLAAVSERAHEIIVWETEAWRVVQRHRTPEIDLSVLTVDAAFTPNERKLLIATTKPSLLVLDTVALTVSTELSHAEPLTDVRAASSGDWITGSQSGLQLWPEAGSQPSVALQPGPVRALAVSPQGSLLASADNTGRVSLWNLTSRTLEAELPQHGEVVSLSFSSDGSRLLAADSGHAILWDVHSRTRLATTSLSLRGASLAPDGTFAALLDKQGQTWLWSTLPPAAEAPEPEHRECWTVAFHPSRQLLASGGDDNEIRIWDLATGHPLKVLKGHDSTVSRISFSPDGRRLASCSLDGFVGIWDWQSGKVIQLREKEKSESEKIRSIEFAPDGRLLALGCYDGSVRLWDGMTGVQRQVLKAHDRRVRDATFSQNGAYLASVCEGGRIVLWNTSDWTCAGEWQDVDEVCCADFSPDSQILATGNKLGLITFREVPSGRVLRMLTGHVDEVRSIAFCRAGRTLASGSKDRQVRLWDVVTGLEVSVLKRHLHDLHEVNFSPTGDLLASCSHDGQIFLWNGSRVENVFTGDRTRPDQLRHAPRPLPDPIAPHVVSLQQIAAVPAGYETQLRYLATFSKDVTGVDRSDFTLTTTGQLDVNPALVERRSGHQWELQVGGVRGTGTLQVQLHDDGTIRDRSGNPLTNPDRPVPFRAVTLPNVGHGPVDLQAADYNRDGYLDLLCANAQGSDVTILLGESGGTFQQRLTPGEFPGISCLAVADLNGDRAQDLIVGKVGESTITVVMGCDPHLTKSDDELQIQRTYPVGPFPRSVRVADFNRDGRPDLLVTTCGATALSILLGTGNGSFEPLAIASLPGQPFNIDVGDVDNDRALDLAAVVQNPPGVCCVLGGGNGAFRPPQPLLVTHQPDYVRLAEINNDRQLDLLTSNSAAGTVSLFWGRGGGRPAGTFEPPTSFSCGKTPTVLKTGDLNSDGLPDVAVLDPAGRRLCLLRGHPRNVFHPADFVPVGSGPAALVVADFNGDFRLDVAIANERDDSITLLYGQPAGDFSAPTWTSGP